MPQAKQIDRGRPQLMKRYIHILLNSGQFQSRVMKEARTALESGLFDEVHIIAKKGPADYALPDLETLAPGITLERVPVPNKARGVPGKLVARMAWAIIAVRRGVAARGAAVSLHHVMLLPVGVLVKLLSRARLVYDAHELETESASLVHSPIAKRATKIIEWAFLRFVDQIIVVSEPIGDWYRARHSAPVTAIHNYPRRAVASQARNSLRLIHDIPDDQTVFIYQGAIQANRGIDLLLQVFTAGMVPNGVLVLMGYGAMAGDAQSAADSSPHVRYQPAVPPDQILSYTGSADVGLCVFDAVCRSYALAMPNKLFEYIQAGLPVVVGSPLSAMSGMVRERGIGLASDLTPTALASALNEICRGDRSAMLAAVKGAADEFTWENEEPRLARVYAALGARSDG